MSGAGTPAGAVRSALDDLFALLRRIGFDHRLTALHVVLGLLASLAETLGITVVLLFFYLASGQLEQATADAGAFGALLRDVGAWSGSLTVVGGFLVALIFARALLSLAYSLLSVRTSEWTSRELRDLIHHQYLTADYGQVTSFEMGHLMEVLSTESWTAAASYQAFTRLIINACSVVVFGLFLLAISWKILLIAAVGGGLVTLSLRRFSRRARGWGEQVRNSHKQLGSLMLTTLEGLRTLRAFGQEVPHHRRFLFGSKVAADGVYRQARLDSWIGPISEAGYLVILALIIASIQFWGTGFATTLTAVALLYRLQPHTREIQGNLLVLAHNGPRVASVRAMIESLERFPRSDGARPAAFARGIEFRDVNFRYGPDLPPALRSVSFTIPAGKTTALVGPSGSGKTTVVQILLRLWDIGSGAVLVDGEPLGTFQRESWLSHLGAAGQDIDIIEGTVLENILLGADGATSDDAIAAARAAGVDLFVEELPERYDTLMRIEGQRFSGGQRQRISLARALLRNPALLILDEAMNALDVELERRITGAIAERMADRTILLITHRLENIRSADHVIWIENGRIVGEGPPSQFADTLFAQFAGDLS